MFNLVLVHSAFPDLTSIKQSSHIEVNQVAISQLALKKKKIRITYGTHAIVKIFKCACC